MCSSFAFEFVVIDFTQQSQLISDNRSQKAKDLHMIGNVASSDRYQWYRHTFSECGVVYSDPSGMITSPFYPSLFPFPRQDIICGFGPFNHLYAYGERMNCPYHISQPNGTVINLNFTAWNLYYGDCLEIRDGSLRDSALLGKFCPQIANTEAPPPIRSTQNHIWMRYDFLEWM